MLLPSKTKYKKSQKGGRKTRGYAKGNRVLAFGTIGLKALESSRLNSRQIEAARKCISRYVKKGGQLWIRPFPHIPVTKKPAEVRMGKGKGSVDHWMLKVKPGLIVFEVDGISEEMAVLALSKAAAKLPFKVKIVKYV